MYTALYLNNNTIRAAVGTGSRRGIRVKSLHETKAPEGSLVNGVVMDAEALTECLQHFFRENRLPKRHVILVLNSSRLTVKMIRAPRMKPKETLQFVNREFAAMQQKQDIAVGYFVEGKNERGLLDLFALRMEQDFLDGYEQMFQKLNIRLESVQSGMGALVAVAGHLEELRDKTCIVQVLGGTNLYSFLFVKGRYLYSSATRVFQEKGTPGFGLEVARTISGMLQFAAAQKLEEQITHLFWSGFEGENEAVCREHVEQMGAQLTVAPLSGGSWIQVTGSDGQISPGVSVFAEAALGMPDTATDLYSNYRKHNKKALQKRAARRALLPVFFALGAGMAALIGTSLWYGAVRKTHDALVRQNESEAMVQMQQQYQELTAQDRALSRAVAELETAIGNLETYPVFDNEINRLLERHAAGLVTVDVLGYYAQTGAVQLQVTADEMNDIQLFVERIEQQEGFAGVSYNGYSQSPQSAQWYGSVEVYLEASERKTEE